MVLKKNYKSAANRILPLKNGSGFTLIEVLVAFAVLSSLLVVILQSYSDTSFFLQRTRLREMAKRITHFELFNIERVGLNNQIPREGKFPEEHELAGGNWKISETEETFMELIPVTKVTYQITWQNGIHSNTYESSILIK